MTLEKKQARPSTDLQTEKAQVTVLGLEHVDEAAELLTAVFLDYPLDQYILEGLGSERRAILARSFKMDCLWKLGMGWPLLGVAENGKLAAVALVIGCQPTQGGMVDYQGGRLTVARLQEMEDSLDRSFGPQTCARILEYYALRDAHKPRQPHLYIESLAALPQHRGKGYGGLLIHHISRLSENDSTSTGVGLDTQDPVNLALYQHFGFRVTGQSGMGPVYNWFLFRPNAQN